MSRQRPVSRVLIVVENDSIPRDRRVWLQCQALAAAGFTVSVIGPNRRRERPYELLEGVHVYRYPAPPEARGTVGFFYEFAHSFAMAVLLMLRVHRRHGFDAMQACNPPDIYFPLGLLCRLAGKRFVFDQHDLSPEIFISRFGKDRGILLWALRLLERATYRAADHVVTVNEWYRQIALERGGLPPSHVTVVRNGPDLAAMRRRAPRLELKAGRPLLCCFLGVMEPHDGVEIAVRAAHHVVHVQGRRDCHFAFLGDGESLPGLKRLARDLDLDEWVTFTGWADDPLVLDYLSTADIGLQPDPWDPRTDISTATKTVEYMAFGLPVVAFNLTETRATAGSAASYAEPNDPASFARAICALLDSPERRAAMGAEGRRRVEAELAWDHQRLRYVEVFDRLLPGRTRPSASAAGAAGPKAA